MNNSIKEYETLREEIGRFQDQTVSSLEYGVVLAAGFLGFALSEFVSAEIRWVVLFIPAIAVTPFIRLILARVRSTWIIGRYIEIHLERKLGLHWEGVNRRLRGAEGKMGLKTTYAFSTIAPLLLIQLGCPLLSLLFLPQVGVSEILSSRTHIVWAILAVATITVVAFEYVSSRNVLPSEASVDQLRREITRHVKEIEGLAK